MISACLSPLILASQSAAQNDGAALRDEIKQKGWIVYCARSDNGSWDLFACRPDGSEKRNITNTPDFEEAGPLFSRDNKKLLYRRIQKGTPIDHDLWGFQGCLTIANADGSNPQVFGEDKEYSWASWSPDGKQIACLDRKGIHIVDLESRKEIRTLNRKGIYQQLFWSPDGQWFTGTGNHAGTQWSVVRMNMASGEINPVIVFQSCTPDWCPDSKRIIFSSRPVNQSETNDYGWTQLYVADGDGQNLHLIYGEDGLHIYGGILSPDNAYALFTKCTADGGGSEKSGAPICIVRMSDTPMIAGTSPYLEKKYPDAKNGPVLTLTDGWEPVWTYEEVFSKN